jgi:hypothetical protein
MIGDPALDFAGLLNQYPVRHGARARAVRGVRRRGRRRPASTRGFYIEVSPVFLVRYGHLFNDGRDRIDGLRKFAARAAASTRASMGAR